MRYNLLSLTTGLLLVGVLLNSCKQDQQSPNLMEYNLPTRTATTLANPKVAYVTTVNGLSVLAVMDADGTHQTAINTTESGIYPTWSPGNSITYQTFLITNDTVYTDIRALDVSVNSNGVPIGSNVRTLAACKHRNGVAGDLCSMPTWSSTSSVNKIAFILTTSGSGLQRYICRVSPTSGVIDTLYQTTNSIGSLTWNPDDSRIAAACRDSNLNCYILILNTSTGAVTDSIALGSNYPARIEWSRASSTVNKLLITASNNDVYYLSPSSGSTLVSAGISAVAGWATWSPDNSFVMFGTQDHGATIPYSLKKLKAFTTTSTKLASDFNHSWLHWHR